MLHRLALWLRGHPPDVTWEPRRAEPAWCFRIVPAPPFDWSQHPDL